MSNPPPVVIDKTTTRVNLGLAASAVLAFGYGAVYLRDIEHAVGTANSKLTEIEAQLSKLNGTELRHDREIAKLHELNRDHERRIKALENK